MADQPGQLGQAATSHCCSHGTFEPITRRTYRVCFECGHVWTKRALRRAFRREMGSLFGSDFVGVPFDPTRFARLRAARYIVRSWFTRASSIFGCQECLHDW